MKKIINKKYIIIFSLIIISTMMIAYSVLMKSLNITGTSEIVANWNVYMSDIKEKESNDAVSKEASITDKLTATFNVGLEKPGGYVVYDITVKNDGDMDAVLNLITNSEEDESIKFTVENIEEGDFLFARNEKTFQVRVEWDKNSESTPEGEVSFSLGLEYVQKEVGSIEDITDPDINPTVKERGTNYLVIDSGCEDKETGIRKIEYRINNKEEIPNEEWQLGREAERIENLKSGTYEIEVKCTNGRGIEKSATIEESTEELQEPTIDIPEGWKLEKEVTIHYQDGQKNFKYYYKQNGDDWKETEEATLKFNYEEAGTIGARITDGTNSKETEIKEVKEIDNSEPKEVNLVIGVVTSNSIQVIAEGKDEESGIVKYEYSKDDGDSWVEDSINTYTFEGLTTGSYPVKIRVTNGSGMSVETEKQDVQTTIIDPPTYGVDIENAAYEKVLTIKYPKREAGYIYEYKILENADEEVSEEGWIEVKEVTEVKLTVTKPTIVIARIRDGVNVVRATSYTVNDFYYKEDILNESYPVLKDGLTPVTISTNGTVKKADLKSEWYSYEDRQWANSVIVKNSYDLLNREVSQAKSTFPTTSNSWASFDGSDDYVDLDYINYDFKNQITMAIKLKFKRLTSGDFFTNNEASGSGLYISNSKINWNLYDEKTNAYVVLNSPTVLTSGTEYTIVATYDGTAMRLYINGNLDTTKTVALEIKPSAVPFTIGANPGSDASHTAYANIDVSQASIYNRALSATEAKNVFPNYYTMPDQNGLVESVNFHEYVYDTKNSVQGASKKDGYVSLDGIDDYINLGLEGHDFKNGVTYAIKMVPRKIGSYEEIVSSSESGGAGIALNSESDPYFALFDKSSQGYANVTASEPLEVGKQYTIVGTYDGKTQKIYVNGKLSSSSEVSIDFKASVVPILIGANPNGSTGNSGFANMDVYQVAIFDRGITDEEVKAGFTDDIRIQDTDKLLRYVDFTDEEYGPGEIIPEDIIESYFTWIPKYRYKLWNLNRYTSLTTTDDSQQHSIPIIFGDYDTVDNKDGECKTPMLTDATGSCQVNDYMTHPAFLAFPNSTGFWIGKFENTNIINGSKTQIVIKPNQFVWPRLTEDISVKYQTAYSYQRGLDSHMMKNTEWGAVAYLANSDYGLCSNGSCGEIRINNNKNVITGYAATTDPTGGFMVYGESDIEGTIPGQDGQKTVNYFNSKSVLASSTHNYTGVFDMAGGATESVMSFMKDSSGALSYWNSKFNASSFPSDSKYYDLYQYSNNVNNYSQRILGDATGELGPFGPRKDGVKTRYISSWHENQSFGVTEASPFVHRGGAYYDGNETGAFYFGHTGSSEKNLTYRIILTPTS